MQTLLYYQGSTSEPLIQIILVRYSDNYRVSCILTGKNRRLGFFGTLRVIFSPMQTNVCIPKVPRYPPYNTHLERYLRHYSPKFHEP